MSRYYEQTPVANHIGFLKQPLNDGQAYSDYNGCFCQKGAYFAAVLGLGSEDFALTPELTLDENIERQDEFSKAVRDFCGMLYLHNPKLLQALDIAELIHMNGFPQKAKIYLSFVIEKFNLDKVPLPRVVIRAGTCLPWNTERNYKSVWNFETREQALIEDTAGRGWMSPGRVTYLGNRASLVTAK